MRTRKKWKVETQWSISRKQTIWVVGLSKNFHKFLKNYIYSSLGYLKEAEYIKFIFVYWGIPYFSKRFACLWVS